MAYLYKNEGHRSTISDQYNAVEVAQTCNKPQN